jgi:hypothetical protein
MKHQAVSAVPAEQEANTVVAVLQKGYMISDRLLRAGDGGPGKVRTGPKEGQRHHFACSGGFGA